MKYSRYIVVLLLFLIIKPAFADLKPYVGFNMNYPEGLMYNPVGRFGLVYETEVVEYYIEHRSSIPEKHDGRGLNFIGLDIKTPKWKEHWNAFLGLSYHNAEFDCKTYCKDLDEVNLRYGVRYKQIFVEGLNDDKFSLGVEWRF